jgi:flagellar motility protein MotE (MotC chaperone)
MPKNERERVALLTYTEALEEADRRVAELEQERATKRAEHAALVAEVAELCASVRDEADELVRYAERRGHRWRRYMAHDEKRDMTFLAGFLTAFGRSAEMDSENELRVLEDRLRAARKRRRELRSLPPARPDEAGE